MADLGLKLKTVLTLGDEIFQFVDLSIRPYPACEF
jgi:hypothetical protein